MYLYTHITYTDAQSPGNAPNVNGGHADKTSAGFGSDAETIHVSPFIWLYVPLSPHSYRIVGLHLGRRPRRFRDHQANGDETSHALRFGERCSQLAGGGQAGSATMAEARRNANGESRKHDRGLFEGIVFATYLEGGSLICSELPFLAPPQHPSREVLASLQANIESCKTEVALVPLSP